MKRFIFKLEPVLRLRRHEEELVQAELAAALRERAMVEYRLTQQRKEEADLYQYIRLNRLNAADLRHIANFDAMHRQRIVDTTIELAHLDTNIERIRARLEYAHGRRRAMERLKDLHRAEHGKEVLRLGGIELDELGSMRHARKSLAGAV